MTNPGRLKDLSDVQELIRLLNLPCDFADQLDSSVRDTYAELWRQGQKRYVTLWRNRWLTSKATNIGQMIASLRRAADALEAMRRDGVDLEDDGGIGNDYARLVTADLEVAKKYDMVEESEFWGGEDETVEEPNDD